MKRNSFAAMAALTMVATLAAGCHVEKTTNGDSKDVNISTPFGGMHVKTNSADVMASIGLPAYPGAQAVKDDGDDNRSANVDMTFGDFQLRVKKAGYRTDDSPDKVEAFYRNGLKRFGDVITCRGGHADGVPARTPEGLTCDSDGKVHINVNDGDFVSKDKLQLKAGSSRHQHIVEIVKNGDGTKFALVVLDLPGTSENIGQ